MGTLINKYSKNNVAQIITFGTMMAKGVVRDVARVMGMPYADADKIAKLIPNELNITLEQALKVEPELENLYKSNSEITKLIDISQRLEGLTRHASTHAAGVVIAPSDLTNYIPLFKSSQGDVTTQYDMKSVEAVGLLKMDFLGLRTLTVIDHTIQALKRKNIDIDLHTLPLDDADTYSIFARGDTIGIFQFESSGMREYLKKLQPGSIEDLYPGS